MHCCVMAHIHKSYQKKLHLYCKNVKNFHTQLVLIVEIVNLDHSQLHGIGRMKFDANVTMLSEIYI